jgi:hypothetical protein
MEAQEPLKATSVKEWKKEALPHPVEFPSGNVALMRRRPLEAFWKAGKIPNSLLPIIEQSLATGKPPTQNQKWTPEQIADLLQIMDLVTIECVVEPQVYPVPQDGEKRDDSKLYVDEVALDDKAFAYQYAIGAVDDLASFRGQPSRDVGAVSSRKPVGSKAKRAPRSQ